MGCCGKFASLILEYDTVKFVKVKNKKVGLVYRLLQLTIIAYLIGYVLIVKKGYQNFSDVQGTVITKVKGVTYTNFTDEEFEDDIEDPSLYRRLWDISDLIIPPTENNAFFIATNVIITPDQKLSKCAESPSVKEAICDPYHNTCTPGKPFLLGNGVSTGECVPVKNETNTTYTCEIHAWCPLEDDTGPLKDVNNTARALLSSTGDFTVLIKNFIDFPFYKVSRRNILNTQKKDYLTKCHYNPITDPLCPVFVLKDILTNAKSDYDAIAPKGGVVAVVIDWDCNLDFSADHCVPTYSFKRMDNPDAELAPGWNFRYANYFSDQTRTLYKMFGIDFVVVVTGRGGRFHIVPLLLNIGSGLALMTVASVVSDVCILYVVKKRELYSSKKYKEVQTEYDEFRNPETETDARTRTVTESPNRSEYLQHVDED